MWLFLAGCPFIDDSQLQSRIDADGDGFTATEWGGEDCDDQDVNVGGPSFFFVDADGDGFGSASQSAACAVGTGLVSVGGDCDDLNAEIFPGAGERCATVGIDDDCDGKLDGDDDDWTDAEESFTDNDGDGYGEDGTGLVVCDLGERTTVAGDCDDTEPSTHPGAIELCIDLVDNDCDSSHDECTAGLVTTWIQAASPGQGFGTNIVGNFDIDGDGVLEIGLPAPYKPGAFIVSFDQIEIAAYFDTAGSKLEYRTPRPAGGYDFAVGTIGEFKSVGLVAGSPSYDDSAGWGSSLLIVEDAPSGGSFEEDWVMSGEGTYDAVGQTIQGRDVDGDGWTDVLVGAPYGDGGCGVAYLLYPPFGETGDSVDDFYLPNSEVRATRFTGTCNGADYSDNFGWAAVFVAGGGEHGSVAVGAPSTLKGGDAVGSVGIWHIGSDTADVTQDLTTAKALIRGIGDYDRFGESIASGDYDGDGVADLAVGAPYAEGDVDDVGAVYLFSSAATLGSETTSANQAPLVVRGPDRSSSPDNQVAFGFSVALAGDMNGDGYDDLAIGAPLERGINDQEFAGAVWVCPGSTVGGSRSAGDFCAARIADEERYTYTGWVVEYGGDLDNDGRDELLFGQPGYHIGAAEIGLVGIWFGAEL